MNSPTLKQKRTGFTLAELLIALAILGIIATFTIPKILDSSTASKDNAILKEDVATIAGAYQAYIQVNGPPGASFSLQSLTPHINYIHLDNFSDTLDYDYFNGSAYGCGGPNVGQTASFRLANGSAIWGSNIETMGGTSATNAIQFTVDPNARCDVGVSNNINTPHNIVRFILARNGRITDIQSMPNSTYESSGGQLYTDTTPNWFTWTQ